MFIKSLSRNHDTRRNQTPSVLTGRCDDIKGCCSTEIHNDGRLSIFANRRNGVHNAIGTDFARIVIENRNAGIFVGNEYRFNREITYSHLVQNGVQRRNH